MSKVLNHQTEEENIRIVKLVRSVSVGFGLTVTWGGTVLQGAFIESILADGPADHDGSLSPGDHILMVNDIDVRHYQFLDVADLIKNTGSQLELIIAKPAVNENVKNKRMDSDLKNINEPLCLKRKSWVCNDSSYSDVREKRFQSPSLVTDHNVKIPDQEACVLYETIFNPTKTYEDNQSCFPDIIPSQNKSSNLSLQTLKRLSMDEGSFLQCRNICNNKIDYKNFKNYSDVQRDIGNDSVCGGKYNVSLTKKNGSLGLNIYQGRDKQIYIHSLICGGAAEHNKLIRPGDKVLEVNGLPLCKEMEYQQVVSLLRESSSITTLVLERGNPCALDPLEELRSVCNSIRVSELSNNHTMDQTVVCTSDVNNTDNYSSTQVTSAEKVGDFYSDHQTSSDEYLLTNNNLKDSLIYDCDHKENQSKYDDSMTLETKHSIPSDFQLFQHKNPLHVICAKTSMSKSKCSVSQEFSQHSECYSSKKLVDFPLCATVEIGKDCPSDDNETQSNLITSKAIQEHSDCNLKQVSKPLACSNSTPNLIDALDDDNETCNQRESLLFRNKSSDCLLSSLPYFEINLLNTCHEYKENHENVAGNFPQNHVRKKKFGKLDDIYNYLSSENTFIVVLKRGTRGLGFSISGGRDSSKKDIFSQLIRIRKLYPLQPAMLSGQLFVGDIILQVNNVKMVGLTNTDALEILRCANSDVTIKVFRPSNCNFPSLSICKDLLPIFLDSPPSSTCSSLSGNLSEMNSCNDLGEFKITLMKKSGSLGFTVSRNEGVANSHPLGIYVKALVREPAISDGRIRPGDRILQVNGTDISLMTHKEAVTFLRNAPEVVILTLFRSDPPFSPNGLDDEEHMSKPLRWEALELLNDRTKNKDNDSPFDKKKMKKKGKNHDGTSSSSVESSVSSKRNEVEQTDSSFDILFQSNIDLRTNHTGMQRCQRPKSLDVLNSSDRKQISEEEDNFYRQTSVTVAPTNQKSKNSENIVNDGSSTEKGVKTLLKWRGSSFPADSPEPHSIKTAKTNSKSDCFENSNEHAMECSINVHENCMPASPKQENPKQIQSVDVSLDRGWHGRLGFCLQEPSVDKTNPSVNILPFAPEVSVVHPNTLAAKDGRIRVGDRLVEVNSESFLGKPAVEAIDILRKTRGLVRMVFSRL